MSEQKKVTCPACRGSMAVDAGASELFCPYCGTRFEADERGLASPGDGERLLTAFERGDYARVIEETVDGVFERDRALGMLRSASEYFVTRASYLEEAFELASKRKAKNGLSRLFLGRDEYSESPIHKQWFEDVERICGALAAEAEQCIGGPNEPLARELALELTRSMLAKKNEKQDGSLYWPTVAIEHFSIPLLRVIDTDRLRELCEAYGGYYKRYDRLPNQERVLAEMKSELEKR